MHPHSRWESGWPRRQFYGGGRAELGSGEVHVITPVLAVAGTAPPNRQRGANAPSRLLLMVTLTVVSPSDGPLVGETLMG